MGEHGCCCPRIDARECFVVRHNLLMHWDEDEPRPGDWDYEECCCGCHHEREAEMRELENDDG